MMLIWKNLSKKRSEQKICFEESSGQMNDNDDK